MHTSHNSSQMIPLSRLLITGPITNQTPKSVITEVLFFHKCRNLSDVLIKKVPVVNDPPLLEEFHQIAHFINPYEAWDLKSLSKAWRFIRNFMEKKINVKWTLDDIGLQTNDAPYSLNACMLYRICAEWSLPLKNRTTIEDMLTMIKISMIAPRGIRKIICINIKSNFEDDKDKERLNNKLDKLKNKLHEPNKKDPGTNSEAIALSAILFNNDITYSNNPIIDYYSKKIAKCYHDNRVLTIYRENGDILDLRKTFNPIFPISYYSRAILEDLYSNCGFIGSIPNVDMYTSLQLNYVTDNFYYGWQEKLKRNTTCIEFENVNNRKDLICYGNYNDGFLPYLFSELVEMYSSTNSLVNPDDTTEDLQPRMISTLHKIATKFSPGLAAIMRRLTALEKQVDVDMRKILWWYLKLSVEDQNYVNNVLNKILHLGMYMRGWKGKGDSYPLKRRRYTSDVDGYVTMSFWPALEEYSNPIGKKILDLPLYRCSYGVWKKSREKKDGLTIYERLQIVKVNSNIHACIRMSSNWFICSVYKYMVLFGLPEPFNLQQTDYIS